MKKLMTLLHILWIQIVLYLTNINLYQIEVTKTNDNTLVFGYCFKTKRYYDICKTPYHGNLINYNYNKSLAQGEIRLGKLINNIIVLL